MSNILKSLEDYLWLIFIAAIFIIFAVPQFIDLGISIVLFFRIILSPKKEPILDLARKLMSLPDEVAYQVISKVVFQRSVHENYDDLIRRFTTIVDKPVGNIESKTGKVKTRYYLDFVAACCDEVVRTRVTSQLAYLIIETLDKKNYSFDYIISLSKGNTLIGLEISKILKKPFVVLGPTPGVESGPQLQKSPSGRGYRYILIDGISSTGEDILYIAKNVHDVGSNLQYVFVAVDRCFHARDRLREESPFSYPIELYSLCEYDDKKISMILDQSA